MEMIQWEGMQADFGAESNAFWQLARKQGHLIYGLKELNSDNMNEFGSRLFPRASR